MKAYWAESTDDFLGRVITRWFPVKRDHKGAVIALRTRCGNPAHTKCDKCRSVVLDAGTFGPRAAEFLLMAWLLESHRPEDEHSSYRPSKAEVKAVADVYGV